MRALFVVAGAAVALGGCTQDENASNAERETHMGEVRGPAMPSAEAMTGSMPTATPTPTGSATATATAAMSAIPSAPPAASARH